MSIALKIDITKDTARPALSALIQQLTPNRVGHSIGVSVTTLVQNNYGRQPHNKLGAPSSHFWYNAAVSTSYRQFGGGVVVFTSHLGVRQRYYGGLISAGTGTSSFTGKPAKYLAIPATQEAYDHRPSTIPGLRFVRFGRGQDAPCALVAMRATSTNIAPKKGRGKGYKPVSQNIGRQVMYWLKEFVVQSPNPGVLPTDDEIYEAARKALEEDVNRILK